MPSKRIPPVGTHHCYATGIVVPAFYVPLVRADAERRQCRPYESLYLTLKEYCFELSTRYAVYDPASDRGKCGGTMFKVYIPPDLLRLVEYRERRVLWNGKRTGSFAYVLRQCLALQYGDQPK